MSRNSVFHYKGKETEVQTVGKELKVQTLLTGRVRQRGDGLTIGVELINAQDNSQMWGQQYNRKLADLFAVQAEALQRIKELEAISGASLSTAHWPAKIYATLNDKEMAFSWLNRGLATGSLAVFYKDEPVWDPIRDDPRFAALKMVVPETAPRQ